MDEVRREFEEYVEDVRETMRAGALAGTDSSESLEEAEELIREYRAHIEAAAEPSRGRELIDRFRRQIERL